MEQDQLHQQLASIVSELQELCAVVRQSTTLSKNTALLLKRHTLRLNAVVVQHGIEECTEIVEENVLLVEQNAILVEQRECDVKSLLRLQEKLDALQAARDRKGDISRAASQ